MKKLFSLILVLLISTSLFAQTADDFTLTDGSSVGFKNYYLASDYSLDSAGTKYSKEFLISGNDGGYAAEHPWTLQYDLTDASGTKISIYWLANSVHPDSTNAWVAIDTLVSGSTTLTPSVVLSSTHGRAGKWNKLQLTNDTTAAFTVEELSIYQGYSDK